MNLKSLWKFVNTPFSFSIRSMVPGETRSHPRSPDAFLLRLLGLDRANVAGITVDEKSAMQISAVYGCVTVLSETMASLPLNLFVRGAGDSKEVAIAHPAQDLVHSKPNQEMTSYDWRAMSMGHLALRGNMYSQIVHNRGMQPITLWPLDPDRIETSRRDGNLIYIFHRPNGGRRIFDSFEILHVKGRTKNGINGLSPIDEAREAFASSIATQQYGNRVFRNDARPYGVLEHPGELTDKAHKRIKDSWNADKQGVENAGTMSILEEGMKWKETSVKPEDAQFLQKRKFDVSDIARIFRVPPHLIQDLDRATFANVEQQSIDFVVHTVTSWATRWEQALNCSLLTPMERRAGMFFKFNLNAMLRGDVSTRFEAYTKGRNWGWLSANDVRRLEDMNPLPKGIGDIYLTPLNMIPAQNAGQQTAPNERKDGRTESRTKGALNNGTH